MRYKYFSFIVLIKLFFFVICSNALAQSSPADLAELSIFELTELKVTMDETGSRDVDKNKWQINYHYRRVDFEGYREGTDEVLLSEFLFDGVPANRTDRNFPVAPTNIIQEAHIFNLGYELNENSLFYFAIPYIIQTTYHVSIIPGYESFDLSSEGIGDVVLSYTYRMLQFEDQNISINLGLSLPTGSIDKQGDTPRAPGDQQLPYTMQLGSGTYDILASVNYVYQTGKWQFGAEISGKFRLGRNDRDYRLGNKIGLTLSSSVQALKWLQPSLKFSYLYTDHIHGLDSELLVPGPFPFPAAITNPEFYGGHKLYAVMGFRINPAASEFKNHAFDFFISVPILQDLNGIQVEEDHQIQLSWKWNF